MLVFGYIVILVCIVRWRMFLIWMIVFFFVLVLDWV